MILLTKKRIFIILSGIVLSTSTFLYFTTSSNNMKTVETVALPVSNKVIVLDAGHRCSR